MRGDRSSTLEISVNVCGAVYLTNLFPLDAYFSLAISDNAHDAESTILDIEVLSSSKKCIVLNLESMKLHS